MQQADADARSCDLFVLIVYLFLQGASEGWDGASAVHTNMTNTRLTDPEIIEQRYPVLLTAFGIRRGSGGAGKTKGGDGVVRKVFYIRIPAIHSFS